MRSLAILFPFVLAALTLRADSLASAQSARALLGPDVWSRIVRIENDNPAGRYPARLHALVFEFDGRLWFYTDTDGTQSFSLHAGRLAEEKADFGPLLRDIEDGFVRHEDVTDRQPTVRFASAEKELRNGCFIEALAYFLRRCETGRPPEHARLLTYYMRSRQGRRGHTVLVYREHGRDWMFDPFDLGAPRRLPRLPDDDPMTVARAVFPANSHRRPVKAVYLNLGVSVPVPEMPDVPRALLAEFRTPGLDEVPSFSVLANPAELAAGEH